MATVVITKRAQILWSHTVPEGSPLQSVLARATSAQPAQVLVHGYLVDFVPSEELESRRGYSAVGENQSEWLDIPIGAEVTLSVEGEWQSDRLADSTEKAPSGGSERPVVSSLVGGGNSYPVLRALAAIVKALAVIGAIISLFALAQAASIGDGLAAVMIIVGIAISIVLSWALSELILLFVASAENIEAMKRRMLGEGSGDAPLRSQSAIALNVPSRDVASNQGPAGLS